MGVRFQTCSRPDGPSLEEYRAKRRFKQVKLGVVVISWQVLSIVLMMAISLHDQQIVFMPQGHYSTEYSARLMTFLVVFVSVFCGWPCLLHCMAGFAKTGVVLSVVNGCLAFQTSMVLRGFVSLCLSGERKFALSIHDLTEALLATHSFHIASLSLLGRMPPLHLLLTSLIFLPGQSLCRLLQLEFFHALDPGTSCPIHLYGAVFGTVSSFLIFRGVWKHVPDDRRESYVPSSVSLTGSFLLALSSLIINSLGTTGGSVELSMVNTCLVQSGTITTSAGLLIALSSLRSVPLDFQLLQGSLLAGGISAGCVAVTHIQPWGALMLGAVTGMTVVLSGCFLEPRLSRCLGMPLSYYITSIHGLPAIIGGLTGVLMAGMSEEKFGPVSYGLDLYKLYPARAYPMGIFPPGCDSSNMSSSAIKHCPSSYEEIKSNLGHSVSVFLGRSAFQQAGWQLVGIMACFGLGLIFGLLGGLVECLLDRLGRRRMPVIAWYDATCFLDTAASYAKPSGNKGRFLRSRTNSTAQGEQEDLQQEQEEDDYYNSPTL